MNKILFGFVLFGWLAQTAVAESGAQGSGRTPSDSTSVSVDIKADTGDKLRPQFSEDVFNVGGSPQPLGKVSGKGGSTWYQAGEPTYNTEQRARWEESCKHLKKVDFRGYQDCFKNAKTRELDSLNQRQVQIEGTSRNSPLDKVLPGSSGQGSVPIYGND